LAAGVAFKEACAGLTSNNRDAKNAGKASKISLTMFIIAREVQSFLVLGNREVTGYREQVTGYREQGGYRLQVTGNKLVCTSLDWETI
jgi:hypothetical protein